MLASPVVDRAALQPPGVETEGDLVRRLKAGDEEAYERLVRTHAPRLLAVARRFFPESQDAQDALQDGFLSAFRAIGSFEGQALLGTWLHSIVVNACLMRLRSRKRRAEESIEPLLPAFDETGHQTIPSKPWQDVEDEIARKQAAARVRALIEQLPESYRTVLLLRDIEEVDTARTAEALGLSENAVKIRLHRARQALRTLLDADMQRGKR